MEKSFFERKKIEKYVEGSILNNPIERVVPQIQRTAAQQRAISASTLKPLPLQAIINPPAAVLPDDRAFAFDGSTHLSTAIGLPGQSKYSSFRLEAYQVYFKARPDWAGPTTAQRMTVLSVGSNVGGVVRQYSLQLVREDIGGGVYKDFIELTSSYDTNVTKVKQEIVNQGVDQVRFAVKVNRGIMTGVFENGVKNLKGLQRIEQNFGGPKGHYYEWAVAGNEVTIGGNFDSANRDYFEGRLYDVGIIYRSGLETSNAPYYLDTTYKNGYGFNFEEDSDYKKSVFQRDKTKVTLTVNGTESYYPTI